MARAKDRAAEPLQDVVLKTELLFEKGRFIGFILRAYTDSECKLIDDLIHGRIPGLEYCQNKTIRPFAGSCDEYFLRVS